MDYEKLHLTFSITDRCKGRNCSFCSTDAQSQGEDFFTKKENLLFEQLDDFNGEFRVCITGGGEPLLARNLYRISHNLFTCKNFCGLGIVTSGADPNDKKEWRRMTAILSESFAKDIRPCLSFHEFGSNFDRRFRETLKFILTKTSVEYVGIKLIHGTKIGRAYRKLYDALNDVLESICEEKKSEEYRIRQHIQFDYEDEHFLSFLRSDWLAEKIGNFSMENMSAIVGQVLQYDFKCLFFKEGAEEKGVLMDVQPQKISGCHGRGKNDPNAVPGESACGIFHEKHVWEKRGIAKLCLQADGYFYPSCSCPKGSITHLGKVGTDSLEKKIKQGYDFFKLMQNEMRGRRKEFLDKDPCDVCMDVWAKLL
jgi:hypothetical protein